MDILYHEETIHNECIVNKFKRKQLKITYVDKHQPLRKIDSLYSKVLSVLDYNEIM